MVRLDGEMEREGGKGIRAYIATCGELGSID